MLKALFFLGLAWLALIAVRRRANGDLQLGLIMLQRSWAEAVHPTDDPLFERLAKLWPLLLPITFLASLSYARSSYGVLSGDGFAWINQARQLDPSLPATFVHPFYNLGWPAVLRLGLEFGIDELATARFAAASFAVIAVLFSCLIARWCAPARVFTCTALAITSLVSPFAALGSTDLPAAALQIGAVWFALDARRGSALISGALLGLAFLFRHQAFVLAFPLVAAVPFHPPNRRLRLTLFLLGLLTAASPQLVANTLVTGNPFWSEQTKNVLFGVTGGGTTRDWAAFPTGAAPALFAVIGHPGTFTHWIRELLGTPSLTLTSVVALGSLTLPYRRSRRAALAIIGTSYCVPLAIAWIEPRFIIVATATTGFIDGYWLVTLAAAFESIALRPLPHFIRHRVADGLLIAVAAGNAIHPVWSPPVDSKASLYDNVSACLTRQSIRDPRAVVTFSPVQVDVGRGAPFESFQIPPATDPGRSIEMVNDPRTTTVLVTPGFLPSDQLTRRQLTDVLATHFTTTCSARSYNDELEVTVFSRSTDPTEPSKERAE